MATTVKIDLSSQAKRWNLVQLISAIALFLSFDIIASTLFDIGKSVYAGDALDYGTLAFQASMVLLGLFMARQTWAHGSVFSKHSLRMLRYAFGIAAALLLLIAGALAAVLSVGGIGHLTEGEAKAVFMGLFSFAYLVIFCIIVVVVIGWLQRSKIDAVGKTVNELLDDASARTKEPPPEAYWHIRVDRPAGVFWVVLGAAVFIIGAALGSVLWDYWATELRGQGNPNAFMQASTLVEIGGVLLILKGRKYFTPRTEAVLAIDKRAPILYLRSFLDETPDSVQWVGLGGGFVDRSLEMKIAKYFLPFGPFVAIGSPKDVLPKLGAMRLIRSDAEWQGEVKGLIESAQLVLASVGNSKWIKWELAEVLNRGLESKSLFIFPVTVRRRWWNWGLKKKQLAQQIERVNVIKELYSSKERPDYDSIEKGEFLLAQVTIGSKTYLLTSRKLGSNAQALSIVVGHYLLEFDQNAARIAPIAEALPGGRGNGAPAAQWWTT